MFVFSHHRRRVNTVNDTIDSVMDDEEDEEESDNIMNQVLDEIGINMGAAVSQLPQK